MIQSTKQDLFTHIRNWLTHDKIPHEAVECYIHNLPIESPTSYDAMVTYFKEIDTYAHITPIAIYHERSNQMTILLANRQQPPQEPGESGCLLSYVRASGLDDAVLASDCYGQLSCSSCAVDIISGTPKNPFPRDEEYDMLDIDESKPPTKHTRLSCQAIVGDSPLIVIIRAPTARLIQPR